MTLDTAFLPSAPEGPPAGTAPGAEEGPRYLQVLRALRDRIVAGQYAVGAQLPTEADLCEEFGVSRHTVREALRRLTDQGYVKRRQGSGTQVISADPAAGYSHYMRSLADLFQYALDTDYVVDRVAPAPLDPATADMLGERPGTPMLRVDGVRYARPDNQVICHTIVHVADRFAWLRDELADCRGPLYALIERRAGTPVAETIQTISAQPMPPGIAAAMGLQPGILTLHILRRYYDADGRLMLASISHHPADRFSHTMRIKRETRD